jgi:membrane protease YdiL (CAAX protease family)
MKEIVSTMVNSFLVRFGIIFTFVGVMLLLVVFSEFEVEGLLVAGGFFLLGIILLLIGSSLLDSKKRKIAIAISIIWIGILLILSLIFFSFVLWTKDLSWSSSVGKQMLPIAIAGTFFGFIFLFIGVFILNGIQEEALVREKIAGISKRNPISVLLLSILTFGVYYIWWIVKTRKEINTCGADIPTPWLFIIPIVSLYFEYKYAEGFSHYVSKDMDTQFWFLLHLVLWPAAIILIQRELNKFAEN